MFGTKKLPEHNVLLLDVENASVGVALAHVKEGSDPILFGEHRITLAVPQRLESNSIAKQIERATHSALSQLGEVAARMRGYEKTAQRGNITHASIFLGAPWGTPNLSQGKPDFSPAMQTFISSELDAFVPDVPVNFYTSAEAAVYGTKLRGHEGTTLMAMIRGEITELVLLDETSVLGYATLPIGSRSLYRTLGSHAGLSWAEVPAVIALAHQPLNLYSEPLEAAGRHMIEHFASGLEALAHKGTPGGVVVLAEEPLGAWFARTLESDESLGALFTPNATVRTIGAKQAGKYLGGHGVTPDLHLSLGALFANSKLAH